MNENGDRGFDLGREEVAKYPWQDILASEPKKECFAYWGAFLKAASQAKENGDKLGVRVYSFLLTLASFRLCVDDKGNPYRSGRCDFDGKRWLQPDHLNPKDLDLLKAIVEDIEDPEFRARVADILWTTRKDFQAAQLAVESFVQSAERLKDGERWPPFIERLDRAAQIAALGGFDAQRHRVVEAVESAIFEYKDDISTGLTCLKLMGVLLKLNCGDKEYYVGLAERLAKRFAEIEDWRFSQEYWRVTKAWQLRLKNEAEVQRCQLESAECDVSNAEGILAKGGQAMSAAHWMSRGLEALRQAKAGSARIKEVHTKLLKIQEASTKELGSLGDPEDDIPGLKEDRKKTQEAVANFLKGRPLEEALESIALGFRPTNFEELLKRDAEQASEGFLNRFFGASKLDISGKVTDKIPGVSPGQEEASEVTRKRLVQGAQEVDWKTAVVWRIEPARAQIAYEHPLRTGDLWYLVRDNPFIEPGHEGIYLHGIQAGFFGDWLVAMHLLVPQIESSIRFVLKQHGVITSKMSSEGIQEDIDLNKLLWMDEVEDIFGPDILFDLRGILIERFGCNLRNELAHGLMPEGAFYTIEAPYLWWLVMHLLYLGHIKLTREEDVDPQD